MPGVRVMSSFIRNTELELGHLRSWQVHMSEDIAEPRHMCSCTHGQRAGSPMGQRKTDVRRFHYAEPIRVVRLASILHWAVVGGEDLDYLDVDDIEQAVRTWAARRRHEAEVDLNGKPEYIIDGDQFSTIDEFMAHFTQVVGDEGRLFEWDGGVGFSTRSLMGGTGHRLEDS